MSPKAYSIGSLAKEYDLSYEQVRKAVKNNEIDAKFSGVKAMIPVEAAEAWFNSLPDKPTRPPASPVSANPSLADAGAITEQ